MGLSSWAKHGLTIQKLLLIPSKVRITILTKSHEPPNSLGLWV